jgi:DNA-binding transcriptional regulator YhcF (GntR family)
MLSLPVSRNGSQPLCDQTVEGIKRQIDDRHLRPGTNLPSIRDFAEMHQVSRFEAYAD